jgi:hypothetical protein
VGTALLDSLERRFLTPDRTGLDAFRRLARCTDGKVHWGDPHR